jgi:hypothetical protein
MFSSVLKGNISMAKGPPIGVRLDDNVRAALEKLAASEDRSLNYLVNKIIAEYLKAKRLLK